jgi:peptidoglycan/LPS O-acetylase OafA/YrhL
MNRIDNGINVRLTGRRPVRYYSGLDGLRAVAALAVVGFHANIGGFANGDIGVDVFFTLSGFLITSILLASMHADGTLDFRRFYERRALRLLPAYLVVVVVCVVANHFVNVGGTLRGAFFSFFYIANVPVAAGTGLGTLRHTWSLSIEEQFYLIWPLLLVFLVRRCSGQLSKIRLMVAALTGCAYVCMVGLYAAGASDAVIQNVTPTRAFELLAGCLLAAFLQPAMTGETQLPWRRPGLGSAIGWVALVGLLFSIYVTITSSAFNVLGMWPITSALTCGVIYSVVGGGAVRTVLGWKPLVLVGRVSYGLYLWHFPVLATIDTRWGLDSVSAKCAGLAITAALTTASYFAIERPFLRMKTRRYENAANVTHPSMPEHSRSVDVA